MYTPNMMTSPPKARQMPPYFDPNTNAPAWNPFSDRDVFNQYQNIGRNQYQRSQDWENEFSGLADYYRGNNTQDTNRVNDLYDPIWQGGGGYSPEQMNNVLQSQGLQDVQNDLPNNFLTGDEQTQMLGDPNVAGRLWSGSAPALMGVANGIGDNMRGEVAGGRGVGNMNMGNWRTMAGGTLANGARGGERAIQGMQQGFDQAIDPTALSVSSGYKPGLDAALSAGESRVSGAESDPGLNVTQDYLHQAGMTDQEVQDMASASARDVGANYEATKDELRQRAAASGTATPLGIAAAETGLNRQSAVDQADALRRGRLDARQAQRNAATGIQGTQLNAGQYRAGLKSGNALALQNSRIAADTGAEQLRLGANSNLAGLRMGATRDLGAADLAQNQYLTSQGMGLARDVGTAENQNNQYFTGQGLNAIDRGGQYSLGTASDIAHTATGLAGTAENTIANRMAGVATNRQGVNQGNQQTQLGINNAASNRYQAGYAPWLANQAEGRAAATGQQQWSGNQANTQNQFRLGGWGTGNQGQLGAAGGYSGWGSTGGQGFGDKLSNSFANSFGNFLGNPIGSTGGRHAHGGMIDHHELIEVGENDRPEVILPLDPMTPPNQQNRWERMGAQLGHAMGLHPKHYATGGVIGLDAPNAFASHLKELDDVSDPFGEQDIQGYARGGPVGFGEPRDFGAPVPETWSPPRQREDQMPKMEDPARGPMPMQTPMDMRGGARMGMNPGMGGFNPGTAMGFTPGPPIQQQQAPVPPPQMPQAPMQSPSMQNPNYWSGGYQANMQPARRQQYQPPGGQSPNYGGGAPPAQPQPAPAYGAPTGGGGWGQHQPQQPQGYGQPRQRRQQGFGGGGYQMGMYS